MRKFDCRLLYSLLFFKIFLLLCWYSSSVSTLVSIFCRLLPIDDEHDDDDDDEYDEDDEYYDDDDDI